MLRPNILYINCHDAGQYLSPYGHSVPTPNLQRFAERSTVFRNAHAVNPTCSPSRAALLTGRYPHQVGMLGLNHLGWQLNDSKQHLASLLRGHSYHTVLAGVEHECSPYLSEIYSESLNREDLRSLGAERDRRTAELAADWLQSADPAKPFFMACGFFWPHQPFVKHGPRFNPNYLKVPPTLPDLPVHREEMADYNETVALMDEAFGIVIDALEKSGLSENTVVLFTTDHGIALPHMKCNLTDHGTKVAFMLNYPSNPLRGHVSDALVSHLDFLPTLADLTKLPFPKNLEGTSLLPLFLKDSNEVREEVYGSVSYHAGYEPVRSVRTHRYRYIRRFHKNLSVNPVNIDDCPSKRALIEKGLLETVHPREELYDLQFDPMEKRNLANVADYAETKADLARRLDTWMQQSDDPLRQGPLPLPADGKVTLRSSIHPTRENAIAGPWRPSGEDA